MRWPSWAHAGEQRGEIKNKSFSVTADFEVPDGGAERVIIAQAGRFGAWSFSAKDGKAPFVSNVLGIHEFATAVDMPSPPTPATHPSWSTLWRTATARSF